MEEVADRVLEPSPGCGLWPRALELTLQLRSHSMLLFFSLYLISFIQFTSMYECQSNKQLFWKLWKIKKSLTFWPFGLFTPPFLSCSIPIFSFLLFIYLFIYLFIDRGNSRKKGREKNVNVWLPLEHPLLETRHVPWSEMEPTTLWFTGQCAVL